MSARMSLYVSASNYREIIQFKHQHHYHHRHAASSHTYSSYPNPDIAFKAIQAHAKGAGYAFLKLDKKPFRAVFACDREGSYNFKTKANWATHTSKQRNNTGSKKCGCLMKVELRLDKVTILWMLQVPEPAHNHACRFTNWVKRSS
jgi:hypothetical protein